ncbi:serine/threonine-protein kinase [Actinomadura atramentaria]|uniref:serine/threonine-protein kinase n=1 Tax=Actinomadura atramentaria TaxID=1990 RepID=UPI0003610F29|nr:serine/threonine-protein kinase [Actinomadura atramentaria]
MEPLRADDPRQVGHYALLGRLGGGGMGQVFLGRSRGGRPVAVKVIRSEFADDAEFRRRFSIEVEAARRVGGFYTAQVVDADPDANPPWLVTAYVAGPSLHTAVTADGPLPEAALRVLGAGLAEGLTAVHGCGLVHRDLKPANVIMADDGPRLIDFGISRALDATTATVSGAVIGTPAFMAPEQVLGRDIGPAADVFALGAVLVFAATGRGPFGTGGAHTLMFRVVNDEPDLTDVPKSLTDLISACLAKDPTARPTLTELLDTLPPPDLTAPPEPSPTASEPHEPPSAAPPDAAALGAAPQADAAPVDFVAAGGGAGDGSVRWAGVARALRVGEAVSAAEARWEAVVGVAEAVVAADPGRAEEHLRGLGWPVGRAAALLVAAETAGADRARRLAAEAEGLAATVRVEDELLEPLADRFIAVDPERALRLLDRAGPRPVDVPVAALRARALAAAAVRAATADRARADVLMRQAVSAAVAIPVDPAYAPARPSQLAEVAATAHAADPARAGYLADLAEQAALRARRPERDRALLWTAVALAPADPVRAEQVIGRISDPDVRVDAWRTILAAAEDGTDPRPLLDAAERCLAHADPSGARRRRDAAARPPAPGHLRDIAVGAARCAPDRAESLAARITEPHTRCKAFTEMAAEVAAADPARAARWLDAAYQAAFAAPPQHAGDALIDVAEAAATAAPDIARHAAHLIAAHPHEPAGTPAWKLARRAAVIVPADPDRALHLVDLAAVGRPMDDFDRAYVFKALAAVATARAGTGPDWTVPVLHRALSAAPSAAWSELFVAADGTVAPDRAALDLLLRDHHGPGRDHLLLLAALASAADDPERAEHLARWITDAPLRDAVFAALAEAFAERAR